MKLQNISKTSSGDGVDKLREKLRPYWKDGCKQLEANDKELLKKFRIRELSNLLKECRSDYVTLKRFRAVARRVGIDKARSMFRKKI